MSHSKEAQDLQLGVKLCQTPMLFHAESTKFPILCSLKKHFTLALLFTFEDFVSADIVCILGIPDTKTPRTWHHKVH